jgi:hypothetical protein
MDMKVREFKWAIGGFIGGFLLCYLLFSTFRAEHRASGLLTQALPTTIEPGAPPVVANPLPERGTRAHDRWAGLRLPSER